jgi:hypothetical protein
VAEITPIKRGDLFQDFARTLTKADGSTFNISDPKYIVLWTGNDEANSLVLFEDRNITTYSSTNADHSTGSVAAQWYDGRSLQSATDTVTVVDNTTDGQVEVSYTACADSEGTGGTIKIEIYRSEGGGSTGYLLVADLPNATDSYVDNVSDAALTGYGTIYNDSAIRGQLLREDEDQSATQGMDALTTPAAPSAALAGLGAGDLDNAVYTYWIVYRRDSDTLQIRKVSCEFKVMDRTTGRSVTTNGAEYAEISADLGS